MLRVLLMTVVYVAGDELAEKQYSAARAWLQRNSHRSGPGHANHTVGARALLADVFQRFQITSMVDAPCGDWNYMKLVNLSGIDYQGFDISEVQIERHKQRYTRDGVRFGVLNLVTTVPPRADLVLSREFWFHIRPEVAARVLQNVRASGARYLITTTHPDVRSNRQPANLWGHGEDWGYYDINVEKPPLSLSAKSMVAEARETFSWPKYPRYLRMYRL